MLIDFRRSRGTIKSHTSPSGHSLPVSIFIHLFLKSYPVIQHKISVYRRPFLQCREDRVTRIKSFESFHLNLKHASPRIPNWPRNSKRQAYMKWAKKVQILSSEREGCLSLVTKLDIKGQTHMISQKVDKWLYIIFLYIWITAASIRSDFSLCLH